MPFTPGYGRRTFSEGDKQIALARQEDKGGVSRCACGCGAAVTRKTAEFHHVIPFWLSQHSGLSNCGALTPQCHKAETKKWAKVIAKTKRQKKRRKVRHPFPCGRASRWSKPVNGIPVPRTSTPSPCASARSSRSRRPEHGRDDLQPGLSALRDLRDASGT
jgi:hypothetical protein